MASRLVASLVKEETEVMEVKAVDLPDDDAPDEGAPDDEVAITATASFIIVDDAETSDETPTGLANAAEPRDSTR